MVYMQLMQLGLHTSFLSNGEFYYIHFCFENSVIECCQLPGTTVLYSYMLRVNSHLGAFHYIQGIFSNQGIKLASLKFITCNGNERNSYTMGMK